MTTDRMSVSPAREVDQRVGRALGLLECDAVVEALHVAGELGSLADGMEDRGAAAELDLWGHLLRSEVHARHGELAASLRRLRRARSAATDAGGDAGVDVRLGIGAVLLELGDPDGAHAELSAAWESAAELGSIQRARCAFLLGECAARVGDQSEYARMFAIGVDRSVSAGCSAWFVRRRVDRALSLARDPRSSRDVLDTAIAILADCADDIVSKRVEAVGRAPMRARIAVARAQVAARTADWPREASDELADVVGDYRVPIDVRADALQIVCNTASGRGDLAAAEALGMAFLEQPEVLQWGALTQRVLDQLTSVAERGGDRQRAFTHLRRLVAEQVAVAVQEADRAAALAEFRLADDRLRESAISAGARVAQLEADRRVLVARAERLEHDSATDPLTGLGNRRLLERHLDALVQDWPTLVSVAMVDADFFKRVNDRYGHVIGDEVLRRLARTLRASSRAADLVTRTGGEEFAVVLRSTGPEDAAAVMERIRAAVEAERWEEIAPGLSVTVSIGVATAGSPGAVREAFRRADDRLYAAKDAGRNRVVADVETLRAQSETHRQERHHEPAAPSPQATHTDSVPNAVASLHELRLDAWRAFDRWEHDRIRSIIQQWRSAGYAGSAAATVLASAFEAQLAIREEHERNAIEASERAASEDDGTDDAVTIDLHIALGYVAANHADCDRALEHLGFAWLRSASVGTHEQQSRTAYLMALNLQSMEHHEHALLWIGRGHEHAALADADVLRARWTLNELESALALAADHDEHGRTADAVEVRRRVLTAAERLRSEAIDLGMAHYVGMSLQRIRAVAIGLLGDAAQATRLLGEIVGPEADRLPVELVAEAWQSLATIRLREGDPTAALAHSRRALDLTRARVYRHFRCDALAVHADVAAALGMYDDALARLRERLAIRAELGREHGIERARIGEIRTEVQLATRRAAAQQQLALQLEHENERLLTDVGRLSKEVELDALTQLPTRAAIEYQVTDRLASGALSFTLVLIDVDRFKSINDGYGHHTGDAVLVRLASVLRRSCSSVDLVGRWGGDEFIAVLDAVTGVDALSAGDRLRRSVADTDWTDLTGRLQVSVSIGAAHARRGDNLRTLFERADAALYGAKREGRNRAVADRSTTDER